MLTIHDEDLARILLDDCPCSDLAAEGLGISGTSARADLLVTSSPYLAPPRDVKVRIAPA